MTQYDLNGIDHIDIVEMPQNATLEQAIEIINTNFSSLSQIADINFVDFITKKIEQRISKGDVSTNNIGKPGRDGRIIIDDSVKNSTIIQGSEFISYNKFGRSVFLTIHFINSASGTQFDVPTAYTPITSKNVIETILLSTEGGNVIYNSETKKIYKSGNLSGDTIITYLSKFTSIENSVANMSDKQDKIDETLNTVSKLVVGSINELLVNLSNKVGKVTLESITDQPHLTYSSTNHFYYDSTTNLIYQAQLGGGQFQFGVHVNGNPPIGIIPLSGVIYIYNSKNYMWNGSKLFEIGGTDTITANTLAFFDTFLNSGNYRNIGSLGGTYIGQFVAPNVKQRVDTMDKIYYRTVNVSAPNDPKPEFTIYGTAQPAIIPVEAEEIKLILGHLNYTVNVSTAENFKISADVDGTSVIFPSLGDTAKSVTFIISITSNPITFNGILIPAGNTVFAIYTQGTWTIDSTVVDIPEIPNYSDISVKAILKENITLVPSTNNTFRATSTIIDDLSDGDLFLLSEQEDYSNGVYSKIVKIGSYNLVKLVVLGITLNTVRVEGDGAYENIYDGFDPSTVAFEKIGTIHHDSAKEDVSNKAIVVSSTSTDLQYASAKAVFEYGQLMGRQDTMIIDELATYVSGTPGVDAVMRLSYPPISKEGILNIHFPDDGVFQSIPIISLVDNIITINDQSYNGNSEIIWFKYFTQIPNLALSEYATKVYVNDAIAAIPPSSGDSSIKIAVSKNGANGMILPQLYPNTKDRTITEINLASNCNGISVTIGTTTYNQTTIIGIILLAGQELIINDVLIKAGLNNANAVIILT